MENILHDFNKKIISLVENYLKNFIFSKGISSFTDDLVAEFANFGSNLTQFMIEYAEEIIFSLDERKEKFESLEKDERNIISIFGEIQYKRRYYEDKENHNKVYLVDKLIGIEPKQRLLENVREKLIENAIDSSYEYSGEHAAYGVKISRQEVKNEIENLNLDIPLHQENENKKQIKHVYVIADEDHVHLQKGGIEEPKIVVVYDNFIQNGKRIELKNKRHFGGLYKGKTDDLWNEVAMYIESTYDMDYLENVFVLGDGAKWIKIGATWINKGVNILDRFHMCKAVNGIAGQNNNLGKNELYSLIRKLDFSGFKNKCYEILSEEMETNTRLKKEKLMNYILNNQKGISNYYKYRDLLHGCSAEGHVSHIYSDRMSSRPMGWKSKNVDNMSKLRVLREDNISVKTILEKQEKVIDINEYKEIKIKAERKIKKNINFKPVSLPIMTFGTHEEKEYFRKILNNEAV